ncbi:hypothetical protein NW070_00715 [Mycoplasmopsis cynos]|nr:hypothetical protein [Mycoplasmopsis cynos]UWV77914.1 hypothetical protein NW070_00715 [Mycoplasmopsis cynos]
MPRQIGIHAAGFVIAKDPLIEIVPSQKSSFNIQQVQMTMNNLEEYGLIKIDFLALKNLTFISEIEKLYLAFNYSIILLMILYHYLMIKNHSIF